MLLELLELLELWLMRGVLHLLLLQDEEGVQPLPATLPVLLPSPA
jgi:hypothetical protein